MIIQKIVFGLEINVPRCLESLKPRNLSRQISEVSPTIRTPASAASVEACRHRGRSGSLRSIRDTDWGVVGSGFQGQALQFFGFGDSDPEGCDAINQAGTYAPSGS